MKKFIILLGLLLFYNYLFAQSQQELLQQAKELIANKNESAALPIIYKAVKAGNTNLEALWMAAYYSDTEGNRITDSKKRQEYYQASKIYAEAALKLYPDNAQTNFVMGVALGRIALTSSSKEKVALSKRIKELGEKCLKLNPNHAGAYHLLGKWHYEVCQLNFFEKAAVDILFDGLPPASYTASINYYEKSISLSPDFVLYVLDYAKTLKAMGKKDMAIAQLNKLIRMKPIRQDDANYMKEGAIILKKLL